MKPSEIKNAFAPVPDACFDAMMTAARGVKEDPVMKKRLSVALILVIAFVAVAAAAIAVAYWHSTAEEIAVMEAENGYFADWSAEDKITLVRLLSDAGELPESPELDEALHGDAPPQRKGELADQVITAWMQRTTQQVSLISIMETMRGSFASWSAEDKVWYNDMLQRLGMLGADHSEYIVPEGEEITQEEAVQIARETFHEAYGVSMEELDDYEVQPTFLVVNWEPSENALFQKGDRLWSVLLIYVNPDNRNEYTNYHADISATGEVLSWTHSKNGELIHSTYE